MNLFKSLSVSLVVSALLLFIAQQYVGERLKDLEEALERIAAIEDSLIEMKVYVDINKDTDERLDALDKRISIIERKR